MSAFVQQASQALLLLADALAGGDPEDIETLWWHARSSVAQLAEHCPQGSGPDRILAHLRQGASAVAPAVLRAWAT